MSEAEVPVSHGHGHSGKAGAVSSDVSSDVSPHQSHHRRRNVRVRELDIAKEKQLCIISDHINTTFYSKINKKEHGPH